MGLTTWQPSCQLVTSDGQDTGSALGQVMARHRATTELRDLHSIFGPVTQVGTLRAPRYGLPGHVTSARILDEMTLFRFVSQGSSTPEVFAKRMKPGGKGLSARRAELSALGEAAERLFSKLSFWWSQPSFRYGVWEDIADRDEQVLGPGELQLFADEQYDEPGWQFDRFTDRSFLGWARGVRLRSHAAVWVPAQLAYFGYRRAENEVWLRRGNTGGIALGPTLEAAILGALEEVLERDSINLTWYCKVPPRPLGLTVDEIAGPLVEDVIRWQRRQLGYDVRLFLHRWSSDYAVVSAARAGGPTAKRRLSVGAAASLDVPSAATRALEELIQQDNVLRCADIHPQWPVSRKLEAIEERLNRDVTGSTQLFEAVLHYGTSHRIGDVASWLGVGSGGVGSGGVGSGAVGPNGNGARELLDPQTPRSRSGQGRGRSSGHDITGDLAQLVARLGLDPIVVDMSGCLRASGFEDLHLVRILVPELTLPNLISWPTLGHSRYRELPAALGYAPRPLTFRDLNPAEMPFG
jgi:ribosomal protein S12 methylthiotransferase accessory factor